MSHVNPKYPTLTQVAKTLWRLDKPVTARIDNYPVVTVPIDFKTDGASVPRMFWSICPPLSNYTNAAVVHDYLCKRKGYVDAEHDTLSSAETHKMFLLCMKTLGVSGWRRRAMYSAVKLFGPRW